MDPLGLWPAYHERTAAWIHGHAEGLKNAVNDFWADGPFGIGVAVLDTTCAHRTDRRSLEADGCGGDRAAVNIRFPPDVNHLRHRRWTTHPALFHHALFVKATAAVRSPIDGAPRARASELSSRGVRHEKGYLRCASVS